MPTHSSAISDNDFTQGQKPVATPPRKPRPKEIHNKEVCFVNECLCSMHSNYRVIHSWIYLKKI